MGQAMLLDCLQLLQILQLSETLLSPRLKKKYRFLDRRFGDNRKVEAIHSRTRPWSSCLACGLALIHF